MSGAGRSSLVDGKNISRAAEEAANGESGDDDASQSCSYGGAGRQSSLGAFSGHDESHRYDCRHVYQNMEIEAEDGEIAQFRCKSWDCYCCAHWMRMNLVEELDRLVEERPELRRFLTLTVDPSAVPEQKEQHRYLTERFNALRTELNDRYDGLSYVWVREEGEAGNPHLHLIVDRYLPQAELSALAERVGLGEVVDIRRVNARNMAKYLTKYLTKGSMAHLPKGCRRYGSSADIDLSVRGGGGDGRQWDLMMDDWTVVFTNGEPWRREVDPVDLAQQKEWGGPVPPPPD